MNPHDASRYRDLRCSVSRAGMPFQAIRCPSRQPARCGIRRRIFRVNREFPKKQRIFVLYVRMKGLLGSGDHAMLSNGCTARSFFGSFKFVRVLRPQGKAERATINCIVQSHYCTSYSLGMLLVGAQNKEISFPIQARWPR
jgi:hypothetical protein